MIIQIVDMVEKFNKQTLHKRQKNVKWTDTERQNLSREDLPYVDLENFRSDYWYYKFNPSNK